MLACAPKNKGMIEACTDLLGEKPKWLGRVVGRCLQLHAHEWHDGARDRLARTIADQKAVRETSLKPRHYCLQPALRPPAFADLDLPELNNPRELADWLQISLDELRKFTDPRLRPASWHYHYQVVSKRRGGQRLLEAPKSRLKALQRRVLHGLLERIPVHDAAHGFLRSRGILSGAQVHLEQPQVLNCDLADFFLCVGLNRVIGLFRVLGYRRTVALCLARLCTNRLPKRMSLQLASDLKMRCRVPHLPQGAPTSPALANLCCYRLDARLSGLARQIGARYTRYADDLTLSGRSVGWLPVTLDVIAQEEGFRLNHRKTALMRSSQRQLVTSVVVNQKPNTTREAFDELKAILHNCRQFGPASQNRSALADFRAHLRGRVEQLAHLNPTRGDKLRFAFEAITWEPEPGRDQRPG